MFSPTPVRSVKVFDGTQLWAFGSSTVKTNGVEHSGYSVIETSRLQAPFFSSSPLDWGFWSFPMPASPKDDEQLRKSRLPDKFTVDTFTVASTTERIGTDDCVVLTAPDKETLWLLPSKGFAPRKARYSLEGQQVFEAEFSDWKSVQEGAWIASTIVTTSYAIKSYYPAEFDGKPLERQTYRLTNLEVNSPAIEAFFRVDPKAGDFVNNETLVAGAAKGQVKPGLSGGVTVEAVNYEVPAKPEDLDRVVQEAVAKDRLKNPVPWYRTPTPWIIIVVAAVGMAVVGVLISRRK